MRKFAFLLSFVLSLSTINYLLSTAFLGCAPKKEAKKIVRIALAAPITGDLTAMGQGMKKSAEMAIEEANKSDEFEGIKLELVPFDDRFDPKEAVNVANQIVSDTKIVGVVGHLNSGCSIPASRVYAQHNLVMISPASTNPKLTLQQLEPSWQWVRNVFRVCTTDDVQGSFGADFAWGKLKLKKFAVIHDKTPYGQGLAEEFAKQFKKIGGTVSSFDGIIVGEKDFKALLTRIKADKPDGIYFGGVYNECGLIIRQAKELGLNVPLISGDACFSPELIKIGGPATGNNYITMVGASPERLPQAKEFLEKYKTKYPKVDSQPYDHYTYEATKIILQAIKMGSLEKKEIIETVRKIKYNGVLGETAFDEKGDTLNKVISVYKIKEGKFIPLN
jgi:branched-chain amino acid transport system substrate-binding protein